MSEHRWRLRRGVVVALGVLVACLGPGATESSVGPTTVKHCITPTAVDLNERYGLSEAIVAAFCTEVTPGHN